MEIIIISMKGDISYADIFRKMRADAGLVDGSGSRFRQTQKEDVMLKLSRSKLISPIAKYLKTLLLRVEYGRGGNLRTLSKLW